jgi:hypothetical protein
MEEPDSWESLADPTDTAVLGTGSSHNPQAMPYSLNVHAQEFVPSFLRKPVAPRQPVEPLERPSGVTTAEETEGSKTLPCTSTDEQRHYPGRCAHLFAKNWWTCYRVMPLLSPYRQCLTKTRN